VPFAVFNGRYAVPGAQAVDGYAAAIHTAIKGSA
jgi:predicted DsbA family dithiol-disulfide isomerase